MALTTNPENVRCAGSKIRQLGMPALALAVVLSLGVTEVHAGSCSRTSREFTLANMNLTMSAHTTVRNDTKAQAFDVQILRSEGEKARQTIAAGEMVGQLAKFGPNNTVRWTNFSVVMSNAGSSETATCSFRIKWDTGSAIWDLLEDADAACGDVSVLCPGCTVSCNKSFQNGKLRWNTTFVISD